MSGGGYDEMTIGQSDTDSYSVNCWGRRNSWFWLMGDNHFDRDIPYAESHGEDVSQDIAIISILDKIKSRQHK